MSLATWKAEFYDVPANRVTKRDALDHSIKKWNGAKPVNLQKHDVKASGGDIVAEDGVFCFDNATCALCQCYQDLKANKVDDICGDCPLAASRDNVSCVRPTVAEEAATQGMDLESNGSPFDAFAELGDPRLMIRALTKAKRMLAKKVAVVRS